MSLNNRKRQQKAEKRNRRQKERQQQLRRRAAQYSPAAMILRGAQGPVVDCFLTPTLFQEGIGAVWLVRDAGDVLVVASFLVDMYCLGVKDAWVEILGQSDYETKLRPRFLEGDPISADPSRARKLVEGAIEYARGLGIAPHHAYAQAKPLWGTVDPALCTETFTYGQNGKPTFISGPRDTPERIHLILSTLREAVGEGNFEYIAAIDGPEDDFATEFPDMLEDDDSDEGDPEDEGPNSQFDEDVKPLFRRH